jgi:hypothetical protein
MDDMPALVSAVRSALAGDEAREAVERTEGFTLVPIQQVPVGAWVLHHLGPDEGNKWMEMMVVESYADGRKSGVIRDGQPLPDHRLTVRGSNYLALTVIRGPIDPVNPYTVWMRPAPYSTPRASAEPTPAEPTESSVRYRLLGADGSVADVVTTPEEVGRFVIAMVVEGLDYSVEIELTGTIE